MMATPDEFLNQVWLTILAGGEGQRIRSFVERWLGAIGANPNECRKR
jgi:hypothetical protein